uniref:Uncharacterized protein n=1 Tax=Rhizophora mucronata TaxID=61149 RepID=A0A2P2PRP8_RHIMU
MHMQSQSPAPAYTINNQVCTPDNHLTCGLNSQHTNLMKLKQYSR